MAWLRDEVWFDTDVLWFREQPRKPFAPLALESAFAAMRSILLSRPGLERAGGVEAAAARSQAARSAASRPHRSRDGPRPRIVDDAPDRRVPAVGRRGRRRRAPGGSSQPDLPPRPGAARAPGAAVPAAGRAGSAAAARPTPATVAARIDWHRATSVGLPYAGRLVGGTQLPVTGPDWVTWNPVTDSVPNLRLPALRQRAHDPDDHLGLRRVPRGPSASAASSSSATSASGTAARMDEHARIRTASTSTSTTRGSTGT